MLYKLLEGLPVILTSIDDDGNTIESLGAGLNELGFKDNQLKGQNVFKNYPEAKNIKRAIESKEEVFFIGKAHNMEIVRQFMNYFIPDPEGGGVIGFSLDITDQLNVQEKLKEQDNFIKHVVSETPDIIYVFDLVEQKNIFINREISDVLGYSNEELISMGTSFYQKVIHPQDIYKFKERNDTIINYKDEEVHRMEVRAINKENKWRWLEARSTPFKRSSDGKIAAVYCYSS